MRKILIAFMLLPFYVFSSERIPVSNTCDAYFFLKDSDSKIQYKSFVGRSMDSVNASTIKFNDLTNSYKKVAKDYCNSNPISRIPLFKELKKVSNLNYITTAYYSSDLHLLSYEDVENINKTRKFIDSDAIILVSSSDSTGDANYNLKLSYLRGLDVVQKLIYKRNVILINVGEYGQDSSNQTPMYLHQNRTVKIFGAYYDNE